MNKTVQMRTGAALFATVLSCFALESSFNQANQAPAGGLVTLYAADDLSSSFNFRTGGPGGYIFEGEVALEGAQIVYDVLEPNALSFGFAKEELVRVIDLGPLYVDPHPRAQDAAPKFAVSAFHTLFMDGARFSYVDAGGNATRHRPANALLAPMVEQGQRSLVPTVGHTYLIRYRGTRRGTSDEVAKFQVVDIEPGRSLTLRWAPIGEM